LIYSNMNKINANNSITDQPVLAITMGDAAGIGPEVIVKALADPGLRRIAKFIIFGMHEQLAYAADRAEIEPFWGRHQHEKISRDYPYKVVVADYDDFSVPPWIRRPSRVAGEASIRFCLDAIDAARAGIVDAIVTAPISKTSWKLAGATWPGHTEMLAERCKSAQKAMMFVAGPLKLALATIHEALFEVRHKFTIGRVFEPIDLLNTALKEYFHIANPKIGVAALNPHAGENGQYGEFDAVVAMYHDQGMIPIKLLAFEEAVNVTIGIPIIRTSPAHGTAFDIAGQGLANPASMKSAIATAIQMATTKKARQLAGVSLCNVSHGPQTQKNAPGNPQNGTPPTQRTFDTNAD